MWGREGSSAPGLGPPKSYPGQGDRHLAPEGISKRTAVPQQVFLTSQTLERTLLHQRACPPSLKLVSRSWRPHLSSIWLPEADVAPNHVPSKNHQSSPRSSTGSASNTWLCAGRDCGLRSPSRTGPYLLRPGAPSSRQHLAQDAAAQTAVWPRLPGVATPSRVQDWRDARNMILRVSGPPSLTQPLPHRTPSHLTSAKKTSRLKLTPHAWGASGLRN